ncbi:PEGA domain-containing protein [Flavobacteriaceae bacterium]|jgi:hypothetical protein|nr:PEGA domain-containing protein [Flavobacteriaceae bacterium]
MRNIHIITASLLLLLTSCASILTGSSRSVLFESNPSGAIIFVNGMEQGTTPATIKVEADDKVDFRLENYRERVVIMDSDFNLVAIINGFSIIGWGIDALTGSLKRVNTKYVKVDLEQSSDGNAFIDDAIKNGTITEVKVNTDEKIIETTIILK